MKGGVYLCKRGVYLCKTGCLSVFHNKTAGICICGVKDLVKEGVYLCKTGCLSVFRSNFSDGQFGFVFF